MNELAAIWGEAIWRASLQGAVAGIAVWLLCRLFPKLSNATRCWLWWLVCLRMLVAITPATIELPLLSPDKPFVASVSTTAVQPLSFEATDNVPLPTEAAAPVSTAGWLGLAWMLGVVGFVGLSLSQVLRTYTMARRAKPCADQEILAEAAGISRRVRLRRCPRLLIADAQSDVVTIGVIRPAVLFSQGALDSCSATERQLVLAHEFAHIKRGDPWLALAPQAVRTLFFFHPVAWLASAEFDLAREADCDEIAIRSLNARSDLYGRLLLKLGVRREADFTLLNPGVSAHFRVLRRRISMLQKVSESSVLRPRKAALALLGLGGLLCVAPITLVRAQAPDQVKAPPTVSASNRKVAMPPAAKGLKFAERAQTRKPAKQTIDKKVKLGVVDKAATKQASVLSVLRLKNIKAADAMALLLRVFSPQVVSIAADSSANVVVVRGDKTLVSQVEQVVSSIDVPKVVNRDTLPGDVVKVFPLKYASADAVAKILNSAIRKDGNSPSISTDAISNSIIVAGNADRMAPLVDLLRQLDVMPRLPDPVTSGAKEVHRIQLRYSKAEDVAKMLSGMPADKNMDFVSYDPTTNSVVVRATEAKYREVLETINHLEIRD